MNKQYTLKASNVRIQEVKGAIIHDLNVRISAREDFRVRIEPVDFRGTSALNAYWMLVDRIVKWSKEEGNEYNKKDFDVWFRREAGLTEEMDMMDLWEMKYADRIKKGSYIKEFINDSIQCRVGYSYYLQDDDNVYKHLGYQRYITETRSISNKGDVTKEEMSRLLLTVIEFGAQNEVPDCFIADREFKRMVEAYDDR